jgi:NAD-dependent SIR2 family protein deacetylase
MSAELLQQLAQYPSQVVLTGAGLSEPSGIPTYRNDSGEWQRSAPIQHREFVEDERARRRYWARSMAGWPVVARSKPNAGHLALAQLERLGHSRLLVTQNVDRLHQRAGHAQVVDLHGRVDQVACLECAALRQRAVFQTRLEVLNPNYTAQVTALRPDGDAEVDERWVSGFQVPDCERCGGVLMPDVVFFGGTVPRARVERVSRAIEAADGLLVVGSSLTVFSGFRFARQAHRLGKPITIINRGKTRADDLAHCIVRDDCGQVLAALVAQLPRSWGAR